MTDAAPYEELKAAAFAFARDARNPDLRSRLKEIGYDGKQDVIVPVGCAIDPDDDRRKLLVSRDDRDACGWAMEWVP